MKRAGDTGRMPGWIFVSVLLAAATLLTVVTGPLWLAVALAVATIASAVAGARLRPDRKAAADDLDRSAI